MRYYYSIFLFSLLLTVLFGCNSRDEARPVLPEDITILGLDISDYPEIEQAGTVFYNADGAEENMMNIIKSAGINTIRLRLWVDPDDHFHGITKVKAFATQLRSAGFKIWLTLHYSDTWADPGSQQKPARWQNISLNALYDSVYHYTAYVMEQIQPDFIQAGNEINNGMLFPEGNRWQNPDQLISLLQTAHNAIRASNPHTKIVVQYAGYAGASDFFGFIGSVDYDIIGISYYPLWHGKSITELENKLVLLSTAFGKPTLIAETAYPFTLQWNDWTNNIVGQEDQLILPDFPASPQGQLDFLLAIKDIVNKHPEKVNGLCYWGADLVSFKGPQATDGSAWENQALFDFNNKVLPAIEAFSH